MKSKFLLIGLFVMVGCNLKRPVSEVSLPFYNQADFTPEWLSVDEIQKAHQIPAFSLTNQNGDLITEKDMEGKIYVANFFFTICPSVCPRMTNNLHRVQEAFMDDEDVMLLSHSVMPWMDSVSVLRDYAEKNDIKDDKWQLLTGEKSKIYSLGRNAYFVDEGFGKSVTDESDFLHTENIILVDQNRHIRGVYNGTLPLEMARLIEDIEKLKAEHSS